MDNRGEKARVSIHGELLEEILLRMPGESISRLKIVCKEWLSLTASHRFALRRNPNPNPAVGLFLCKREPAILNWVVEYLSFDGENSSSTPRVDNLGYSSNIPGNFKILQSCNGFLLCHRGIWPRTRTGNGAFFVYNPTTTHHLELPEAYRSLPGFHNNGYELALAFDPEESHRYKVICVHMYTLDISFAKDPRYLLIQVYSSETGYWRDSGGLIEYGQREFLSRNVVFWNRSVVWISGLLRGTSLYFNIDDERVGVLPETPLPHERGGIPRKFKILAYSGESCGHLNIIERYEQEFKFCVYELENHYSEWFIKYNIDFTEIAANLSGQACWDNLMGFHCLIRGKTDEDAFLVVWICGKLIRYIIGSCRFAVIREIRWNMNIECYQYIESVCCV